ncbi:MAG: transcriptional repressor [Bacteroidota bacterium]
MINADPIAILKHSRLKNTWQRVRVLEEITGNTTAVSQPELEKKIGKEIDRVTLYRILNTYEDKGILHRIIDQNGTANYAICSANCSAYHHHDEHLHFNCTNCGKVYCLETKIPAIEIPKGFETQTLNLIAYGICAQCALK